MFEPDPVFTLDPIERPIHVDGELEWCDLPEGDRIQTGRHIGRQQRADIVYRLAAGARRGFPGAAPFFPGAMARAIPSMTASGHSLRMSPVSSSEISG